MLIKSIVRTNPELLDFWDFAENNKFNLNPAEINKSSQLAIAWKCFNGHSWRTTVGKLLKRGGCDICAGFKVLLGFNDLATVSPELLPYWDIVKNDSFGWTLDTITWRSTVSAWWSCDLGHSWTCCVNKAVVKGLNCPYCSNERILRNFNDLGTSYPELLAEWDFEKNDALGISPWDCSANTSRRVHWRCFKGHSWRANIVKRTGGIDLRSCPHCNRAGSLPETEISDFIESFALGFTMVRNSRSIIPPKELDIYLPELNLAIEFNGLYWHSDKFIKDHEYHYKKFKQCKKNGIRLIQIWEDDWKRRKAEIKLVIRNSILRVVPKILDSTVLADNAYDDVIGLERLGCSIIEEYPPQAKELKKYRVWDAGRTLFSAPL